ncbi:MAG: hypothetical protein KDA45_14480 [Planctomycetales bacterium]|nr:hypothetical protein [Planctomycetales bacterium]
MAMTQREKYLALGVGVVVGLFAVQYAFQSVRGKLQAKQALVEAARSEHDDITRVLTAGEIAANKLKQLVPKSLPTQTETLVAQYKEWLTQAAQQAGLASIAVGTPDQPFRTSNAFAAYNFSLRGQCRTDQLIDLLAAYYRADYLHSLKSLKVTLTKEPNVVNVMLDTQALALAAASPNQPPTGQASGRLRWSVDEYKQAILQRNPFSPPNQPPKLADGVPTEIYRGQPWKFDLAAQDEENHQVDFALAAPEEAPAGLQLRGKSLQWTPQENGKVEVLVQLTDNGWPRKTTQEKLTLNVVDPPKPEPTKPEPAKFDVASQAFVSALLSGRTGPEVWIRSRTDGKTHQLSAGSDLEIGSVKAKVVSINLREGWVELESDGMHWTIGTETSLADAYAKRQID